MLLLRVAGALAAIAVAAGILLWLVTGEEKRGPLEGLMAGDESIPAGRVRNEAMTIVADEAASPG